MFRSLIPHSNRRDEGAAQVFMLNRESNGIDFVHATTLPHGWNCTMLESENSAAPPYVKLHLVPPLYLFRQPDE